MASTVENAVDQIGVVARGQQKIGNFTLSFNDLTELLQSISELQRCNAFMVFGGRLSAAERDRIGDHSVQLHPLVRIAIT